jgi:hypothetical protein
MSNHLQLPSPRSSLYRIKGWTNTLHCIYSPKVLNLEEIHSPCIVVVVIVAVVVVLVVVVGPCNWLLLAGSNRKSFLF